MSGFRALIVGLAFLIAVTLPAIVLVGTARAQNRTTRTPDKRREYPRFEMDVLVNGDPLQEYYMREHRFVKALRGEEYEVRIRNRSDERVAVALYVDGLNTIDATRTPPEDASKWLIEPRQTITIKGWQMSSEHARRFYFTDEPDSYAAKLGVRGTFGVIWAAFYRERRPQIIVPPPRRGKEDISREERQSSAEAPTAGARSRARDEAATGIGRTVRHDVQWVDMDLERRPTEEITIRYNYGQPIYAPDPRYIVPGKRDN